MKKFVWVLLLLLSLKNAIAQNPYWAGEGLRFNHPLYAMYYDSLTEKSYIAGTFTAVNGNPAKILVYDGMGYNDTLPPPPSVTFITSIVRYKNKLYVGGGLGLAAWDGSNWTLIDENAYVWNLKVIDDKLFVCGAVDNNNIILGTKGGISIWNDTAWSGLFGVDSILKTSDFVRDVAFYKGKVYVAGNFYNPNYPELEDLMMYDGQSWKKVGIWGGDAMGGATKMLVWRDTLYVAGMYVESPIMPGNNIAAWDGQNWHRLQMGVHNNGGSATSVINDFRVYNDELWVAGFFSIINGRFVDNNYGHIAKWDGSQWCTMDTRLLGTVTALGTWKDELFAIGSFALENDTSVSNYIKWMGGSYTDTCNQNFTVGVDEVKTSEIQLEAYPVPAKDKIFVVLSSTTLGSSIRISLTDALGRYSKTELQNVVNGTLEINLSTLPAGVYYLNLSGNNSKGTAKFIKL